MFITFGATVIRYMLVCETIRMIGRVDTWPVANRSSHRRVSTASWFRWLYCLSNVFIIICICHLNFTFINFSVKLSWYVTNHEIELLKHLDAVCLSSKVVDMIVENVVENG